MQITFTGKQFEVTEALKRYTERKLAKYEKQLRKLIHVHVVQSTERSWQEADIHITADGTLYRGVGRSDDMYNSIDIAVERIEDQIKGHRGKLIDTAHGRTSRSRPSPAMEAPAEPEQRADPEDEMRSVRTTRVQLTPMSVDEAIDEMQLLRQQFLMFVNGDTGRINVVYQRDSGYGLIDPDY